MTVHNNNVAAAAASIPPRQVEVVVVVGAADVVVVRALLGGRGGRVARGSRVGRLSVVEQDERGIGRSREGRGVRDGERRGAVQK